MGRFCNKHVIERTDDELIDRKNQLIGLTHSGPGQRAELVRIELELMKRDVDQPREREPYIIA